MPATKKDTPPLIVLKYRHTRDTANFRVYEENGGINKFYLPLGTGPANKLPESITVTVTRG